MSCHHGLESVSPHLKYGAAWSLLWPKECGASDPVPVLSLASGSLAHFLHSLLEPCHCHKDRPRLLCWRMRDHMEESPHFPDETILEQPHSESIPRRESPPVSEEPLQRPEEPSS